MRFSICDAHSRLGPAPRSLAWALLLGALLVGCGDDKRGTTNPFDIDEPVPDFALLDTNPNSVTHGELVSPRDFSGKVSAWYFGHAT